MGFNQPYIPLLPDNLSFQNKTIVLTGATGGIGRQLGLELLRRGCALLILAVRDPITASATRLELLGDDDVRVRNPSGQVKVEYLDLSVTESVLTFADKVIASYQHLHHLILNAGFNTAEFRLCPAGHETCMQINVLSNAVLTLRLLPLMQKTSGQQIVNSSNGISNDACGDSFRAPAITFVGSMGHAFNSFVSSSLPAGTSILSHYDNPVAYSSIRRYPDSKLFVALFARQLAAHLLPQSLLDGSGSRADGVVGSVEINTVCPGTVKTGADNGLPWWLRWPMNANRALRGRSVEEGARAVLWAAACSDVLKKAGPEALHVQNGMSQGVLSTNGYYVADNCICNLAPFGRTTEEEHAVESQIWDEIVKECIRMDPRSAAGIALLSEDLSQLFR